MTKTITKREFFPILEYNDDYSLSSIDKEFCERKGELPNWGGKSIYIKERLAGYLLLTKHNRHLTTNTERLKLLKDISNDDVLLDYRSCQQYADRQVKEKDDYLSDNDFVYSFPLDKLANFILFPDQKKYGIMTNEQLKNEGRRLEEREEVFYDEKGKEIRITKIVKARYKRTESLERQYNSDDSNSKTYEVRDAFDSVVPNIDLSVVDLSNAHHVKILLEGFEHWKETIVEKGNASEEFLELLSTLDKTIETSNFSSLDLQIINLLKYKKFSKLSYRKIHENINMNNPLNNISYKQLTDRCSISIPSKIAKTYKKHYEYIK